MMKLGLVLAVIIVMIVATVLGLLALSDPQGRGTNYLIGAACVDIIGALALIVIWWTL